MSRDWLLYLDDLIDSAQKLERFLRGRSRNDFAADELLFDAVLFNLALIGEWSRTCPNMRKRRNRMPIGLVRRACAT